MSKTSTPSQHRQDPSPADLCQTHPDLTYDDSTQKLLLGSANLAEIAEQVGTPCWVINADILRQRACAFKAAFAPYGLRVHPHFAVKAQDNLAVLSVLQDCGFGADIVSGGELKRALAAGIPPHEIVFSGIGKTDEELRLAVSQKIAQINIESREELHRLNNIAMEMGSTARVALRVNPDIDAKTHDKITTGRAEDKFGIHYPDILPLYHQAQTAMKGVDLKGLAVHLGSQILTSEPYRDGYTKLAEIVRQLRAENLPVEEIDCGGGLGITYRDENSLSPAILADIIAQTLGPLDVTLRLEPGRWIVGPAGVLLSKVVETKAGPRNFAILDAGMTELMRPALYESWHGLLPLQGQPGERFYPLDVAGPICESSDIFARNRLLPPLKRGDLVALLDAGAYGSVMSSTYNTRPLAAQIMTYGTKWAIIRPRQNLEALLAQDIIPPCCTSS